MPTLREARTGQGLTQRARAARAGVARVTVSGIERGVVVPRPPPARRLSAALGLAPSAVAEFRPGGERTRRGHRPRPEPPGRLAGG